MEIKRVTIHFYESLYAMLLYEFYLWCYHYKVFIYLQVWNSQAIVTAHSCWHFCQTSRCTLEGSLPLLRGNFPGIEQNWDKMRKLKPELVHWGQVFPWYFSYIYQCDLHQVRLDCHSCAKLLDNARAKRRQSSVVISHTFACKTPT